MRPYRIVAHQVATRRPAAIPLLSIKASLSTTLYDPEFGDISYRRHRAAKYVRIRMSPDGKLVITLPKRAPLRLAEQLLNDSRSEIRKLLQHKPPSSLRMLLDGSRVGHSHTVHIVEGKPGDKPSSKLHGLQIIALRPPEVDATDSTLQNLIHASASKALQKEARAYLPRRLRYLANEYGYNYQKVRFGTQKGRWGSCSSNGTISLNVALMGLPIELIDYVLVHELCHTKQMNHSKRFWALVEDCMPDYGARRKLIKVETPTH